MFYPFAFMQSEFWHAISLYTMLFENRMDIQFEFMLCHCMCIMILPLANQAKDRTASS